jgi:hypothetical protein
MRVVVLVRQTLTPGYERTLQRLLGILLGVVSKFPINIEFSFRVYLL